MIENLFRGIKNRSLRLTVLGAGYVGLPTATLFAGAGFRVIVLDVRPEVVKSVNSATSTINEPDLQDLISQNVHAGRLKATLDSSEALSQTDVAMVSVQTPINQDNKPDLSFLVRALEYIEKTLRRELLVVVSSTLPPGTMMSKIKPMLQSSSGLEADIDFYLAYVPERIAPGKALKEFIEGPRLVGGVGLDSTRLAAELFRTVCMKVIETDAATAEVAKLAENTFRDVNIGFANQLALICEQVGVDAIEVIKLANTHPRVNIHSPGSGVGGPCLPKDPYLLISQCKLLDCDVIKTARQLNDFMPNHTVNLILRGLEKANKKINKTRIAVLGTAYKADVEDTRLSPSGPIISKLTQFGAEVAVYDPYSCESFGGKNAGSLNEAVKGSDCMVILTDHTQFKNLNLEELKKLMKEQPVIVDGKRIVDPCEARRQCFIYYGIGLGKT